MKLAKKLSALLLALAMTASLAACGDQGSASSAASGSAAGSEPAESVTVRVAALKGPTAMGLAQLMEESAGTEGGEAAGNLYDFTLAASADEVTPALLQGDLDVACVPANLAAVLYQKTEGQVVTLAVNTLGVLYIVENGNAVQSLADLKGKTIAVKNATAGANYAEELKDKYGFKIDTYEDSPTMYQAVVGGQVAACFDDTPIMASNIKDTGLGMKIVDGTGNDPAEYGFAIFDSSKQELVDMFNAGLKDIKANGKYDEIIATYLG